MVVLVLAVFVTKKEVGKSPTTPREAAIVKRKICNVRKQYCDVIKKSYVYLNHVTNIKGHLESGK